MASDDAIGSFAQDGVAIIRGVVGRDLVAALKQDIGLISQGSTAADVEYLNWRSSESFAEVALKSPLPSHAADFLDSFRIRLFLDRLIGAESSGLGVWQQDQTLNAVDSRSITATLAVDSVPKGASPEYWAGSHLGSWYLPAELVEAGNAPTGTTLKVLPDLAADESSFDIRRWALEPGDVVYASSLTVTSLPAKVPDPQLLSFTYVDADAVWADGARSSLPVAEAIRQDAEAGEQLDETRFPIAWPQT